MKPKLVVWPSTAFETTAENYLNRENQGELKMR